MGKPKYYWYGSVKKMIMHSSNVKKDESLQAYIFKKAIEEATRETLKLPNGKKRMQAVNEILIKQTKTYDGVASELNYEQRTIQSWITSFVNLVGKKAGY